MDGQFRCHMRIRDMNIYRAISVNNLIAFTYSLNMLEKPYKEIRVGIYVS